MSLRSWYRDLRIINKLLVALGVIGLFMAVVAALQWRSATLVDEHFDDVIGLYETQIVLALDIERDMHQCRSAEQAFLLQRERTDAERVEECVAVLQLRLREFLAFEQRAGVESRAGVALLQATQRYLTDFREVVEGATAIGLKHDEGLQGRFRELAREMEADFAGYSTEHARQLFSLMRIAELEYVARRGQERAQAFTEYADQFAQHLEESRVSGGLRVSLQLALNDYRERFHELAQAGSRNATTGVSVATLGANTSRATETLRDLLDRHDIPGIAVDLLQARSHEKDFLARTDRKYVELLDQTVDGMRVKVERARIGEAGERKLVHKLEIYRALFHQLVEREAENAGLLTSMRRSAEKIGPLVAETHERARAAVQDSLDTSRAARDAEVRWVFFAGIGELVISVVFLFILVGFVAAPLRSLGATMRNHEHGVDLASLDVQRGDELGELAKAFHDMIVAIREQTAALDTERWIKSEVARLVNLSQGMHDPTDLAKRLLSELAKAVGANHGAFYVMRADDGARAGEPGLELLGGYALTEREWTGDRFALGQGLVGQCALEKAPIVLTQVPGDYIRISSGLGEKQPREIVLVPLLFEGSTVGVIELASLTAFTQAQRDLVEQVAGALGVLLTNIEAQRRTRELLHDSRALAATTQTQAEELEAQNEIMSEKSRLLQAQAEELQATNEELEEKSEALRLQKAEVERKNEALGRASDELHAKAIALEQASTYKSEFLANMSHELRTPLNSLLILAKSLWQNKDGNLTERQVQAAQVIHSGGMDLLTLINDILDLSKIEAGKMEITVEQVSVRALANSLEKQFSAMAEAKELAFRVDVVDAPDGLSSLETDGQRVQQILRNFLSNAIKFTETGHVTLRIHRPSHTLRAGEIEFTPDDALAFSVIDTGIGVPEAKQQEIFDAFQQADGSVSRKFGGTGLGLTISREMARLLGGAIELRSEPGVGSTFTLYLPLAVPVVVGDASARDARVVMSQAVERRAGDIVTSVSTNAQTTSRPVPMPGPVSSRQAATANSGGAGATLAEPPGERSLLVIEDDPDFAEILCGIARAHGYVCLVASTGRDGLKLAAERQPRAIVLDLGLPDVPGLQVLDMLKRDMTTRHIPVHIISGRDMSIESLKRGAFRYAEKPVSAQAVEDALAHIEEFFGPGRKHILVVEDDPNTVTAIRELLRAEDVHITAVRNGKEARARLLSRSFDCVILDLALGDITGFELLQQVKRDMPERMPPIIVYTGRELSRSEHLELMKYSSSIVVKGASSPERLLDEVTLFLHSVMSSWPEDERDIVRMLHDADTVLRDKKVLLVDDDLRNAFALSGALREYGMEVTLADNGQLALERLEEEPDVDIILMDVMMPVMDGYECMRCIRAQTRFADIPILAVTARAMPDDRGKCLDAGANDYVTKPIDVDKLVALMRIWLFDVAGERNPATT